MGSEFVTVDSTDGVSIPVIKNVPDHRRNEQRGVLMLHGITTSKDEYGDAYRDLAEQLARNGDASLRLDFRGHGDSEADLRTFSVDSQVIDIVSVVNWAKTDGFAGRITILAASFAAPAALCATYALGDIVERLVLLAPVLDFERTFVEPTTPWGHECFGADRLRKAIVEGSFSLEDGFILSGKFAVDLLVTEVEPLLAKLKCDVVVLHGDQDGMVPFAVSQQWAQVHPEIRFFPMANTEHGLSEVGDDLRQSPQSKANTALLVQLPTISARVDHASNGLPS